MREATCDSFECYPIDTSFFDPVKEFYLLEGLARISAFVAKSKGAAVATREESVDVRSHKGVNRPTSKLDNLLLLPQEELIGGRIISTSQIQGKTQLIVE